MQFSPLPSYLVPLRPKYYPQNPIKQFHCQHFLLVRLPKFDRTYVSLYLSKFPTFNDENFINHTIEFLFRFIVHTSITSLTQSEDTSLMTIAMVRSFDLHSMLPPAGGISLRDISAICRLGCECISRVLVLRAIRRTTW
jgi:hypothetical protein